MIIVVEAKLFHGYRLDEVAWLVHVAATAHGRCDKASNCKGMTLEQRASISMVVGTTIT